MAQLTGFDYLYLEDSFFLGFGVVGSVVELRAQFALTFDHPLFEPPLPGEQHCYREGVVEVVGFRPLDMGREGRPLISSDPDGTLDLGSIEVAADAGGYRITTDWFDMHFAADSVKVILDGDVR